jgi:hypothetical protein
MARHTLVVRRNGELSQPRAVRLLLERLAEQPGVESVRVEAAPLCVVLRVVPELADEAALRALVYAQHVELESRVVARPRPPVPARPPSLPPSLPTSLPTSRGLRLVTRAAPLR